MHHAVMHVGIANPRLTGKTFLAFPAHAQPAVLGIWQEAHGMISNHQPHDCLLNRLFRHRSKKTSKLRVTGLCVGNSQGTGEFPAQMASNAENVSIWWRHHDDSGWCRSMIFAPILQKKSWRCVRYCFQIEVQLNVDIYCLNTRVGWTDLMTFEKHILRLRPLIQKVPRC